MVVSPSLAAGTVLVGSFATAGRMFTRGRPTISTGFVGDDFQRNLSTTRAEERLGLAVVRPSHLVKLTVTAGA